MFKKKVKEHVTSLLKKKFFILRLFLKTLEFEVCYALHLFRIKRRSSKNSTKLT